MFTVSTLSLDALKDLKIEKDKEEKGGRGNAFFLLYCLMLFPNFLSTFKNTERYLLAFP